MSKRQQRAYDHRLVRLVQDRGDASHVKHLSVPWCTFARWLKRTPKAVTTAYLDA